MIEILKEKCTGCSACIKDCPAGAIKLEDGRAAWLRKCIQCGHCVAVCPQNAVSIPSYEMEDVEEYDSESFRIEPENFLHAVKFRRSIRNFKDRHLEKEVIGGILQAGRYTATAKNMQDCTFVVVQERLEEFRKLMWDTMPSILEEMEKVNHPYLRSIQFLYRKWEKSGEDSLLFNADALLVTASEEPLDAGLAAANMEMMAAASGAGVLYSGFTAGILSAAPALREWLGLGEKKPVCCMLLGYPAVTYRRTAPRRKADIIWR